MEPSDNSPMEQQLLVAVTRLEAKIDVMLAQQNDHEERIRRLEQMPHLAPWKLWTAVTSAVAAMAALSNIIPL